MKSKFSECPDFSCSRSDGTLEPVTSTSPAASESLRANSQSSTVVQPVRPLSRSFSPVRVQSGKIRCHTGKARCHKTQCLSQFAIFQATTGKTYLWTSCLYIENGKQDKSWRSRQTKSRKENSRIAIPIKCFVSQRPTDPFFWKSKKKKKKGNSASLVKKQVL